MCTALHWCRCTVCPCQTGLLLHLLHQGRAYVDCVAAFMLPLCAARLWRRISTVVPRPAARTPYSWPASGFCPACKQTQLWLGDSMARTACDHNSCCCISSALFPCFLFSCPWQQCRMRRAMLHTANAWWLCFTPQRESPEKHLICQHLHHLCLLLPRLKPFTTP